jgi:hypothetical protein
MDPTQVIAQTLDQVTVGAVVAFVFEYLKRTPWFPWLSDDTSKRAKVVLSSVVALATSLGIAASWQGWTLTVDFSALPAHLYAWMQSWAVQHGTYHAVIKTDTVRVSSEAPAGPSPETLHALADAFDKLKAELASGAKVS